MSHAVNLRAVIEMLETALSECDRLHGTELDDSSSTANPGGANDRSHREQAAILSRDLLVLSDGLGLAGALVKAEYWHLKGYPTNPLVEEAVQA